MKEIKDFIKKLKDQDELMSLDEVNTLVNSSSSSNFSKKWTIAGVSTVLVLGAVGLIYLLSSSDNIKNDAYHAEEIKTSTSNPNQLDPTLTDSTQYTQQVSGSEITLEKNEVLNTDKTNSNPTIYKSTSKANVQTKSNYTTNHAQQVVSATESTSNPTVKDKDDKVGTVKIQAPTVTNSAAQFYSHWEKEAQTFTISTDKANILKGKEGTILIIPPKAVCGSYESFSAEITLKEYYKCDDIVLGQLTTMSHDDMLESAGMVDVRVEANGKELKLCKNVTVLFPSKDYDNDGYIGFSGMWNPAHSHINWEPLPYENENFYGGMLIEDCEIPAYQKLRFRKKYYSSKYSNIDYSEERKAIRDDEVLKKIRRRFWFRDSVPTKLYNQVYDGIKYQMKDSMSARAYWDCRIQKEEARKLKEYLATLSGDKNVDLASINRETGYIVARIDGFGTINCDRFTNYKKVKDYTYQLNDSIGIFTSRMIFEDIKSILPGIQTGVNQIKFNKIPPGQQVTLLTVNQKDNGIQVSYDRFKTGENPNFKTVMVKEENLPNIIKLVVNGNDPILPRSIQTNLQDTQASANNLVHNAIKLTKEELENFFIYQHDDVLLYSNYRDTVEGLEVKFTSGTSGFSSSSRLSTPIRKLTSDHPKAIVAPGTLLYIKRNIDIKDINCEDYIPLLIPFDHGVADYAIWWFEKNDNNIGKLPERYLSDIEMYCVSAIDLKQDTLNQKLQKIEKNKETLPALYADDQVIKASSSDLKKLGDYILV